MMQNPSNYINDWLWHRVHVSADGLTMERDVSVYQREGENIDFLRTRLQTHACEYMRPYSLFSDAFLMWEFARFYISNHVFLNRHSVHNVIA